MATTLNLTETGQHLRDAYLHVVDYTATNPTDMAEEMDINVRYARELMATLKAGGLLTIDTVDGEDIWQPSEGHPEDLDPDLAQSIIDEWLVKNGQIEDDDPEPEPEPTSKTKAKPAPKPKPQANPADLPLCKCGCGTPVGRKSNYKPGHDARHAGNVARQIADNPGERDMLLATLPSDKLRVKARDMADRLLAKDASGSTSGRKSATKRIVVEETLGQVKRGKTWYPGKIVNGVLYRNTKKDGTGTWNEADQASEFIPNDDN